MATTWPPPLTRGRNDTLQIAACALPATRPHIARIRSSFRPVPCHTPSPPPCSIAPLISSINRRSLRSLTTDHCSCAVGPSALPCAGAAPPQRPPTKPSLTDLVCSFQPCGSSNVSGQQCLHPYLPSRATDHSRSQFTKKPKLTTNNCSSAPPQRPAPAIHRAYSSPATFLANRVFPPTRYLSPLTPAVPLQFPCSSAPPQRPALVSHRVYSSPA